MDVDRRGYEADIARLLRGLAIGFIGTIRLRSGLEVWCWVMRLMSLCRITWALWGQVSSVSASQIGKVSGDLVSKRLAVRRI